MPCYRLQGYVAHTAHAKKSVIRELAARTLKRQLTSWWCVVTVTRKAVLLWSHNLPLCSYSDALGPHGNQFITCMWGDDQVPSLLTKSLPGRNAYGGGTQGSYSWDEWLICPLVVGPSTFTTLKLNLLRSMLLNSLILHYVSKDFVCTLFMYFILFGLHCTFSLVYWPPDDVGQDKAS